MKSTYRLAGHTIRIESLYSQVHTLCEAYRVDDKAEYCITTTPADIAYERQRSARADELEGVAVNRARIINIDTDGVYTMSDGRTFAGRKRGLSAHRHLRKQMGLNALPDAQPQTAPMTFLEKCTLLDEMPLAYCVIELVFNAEGHGVDFIFRYCNAEMAVMEGVPVEEMLNRSFYEVFRNGDKKWLVAYADVALNGTKRILHDYSPEIGKYLTIYCYQPAPGFCACVLQKADA